MVISDLGERQVSAYSRRGGDHSAESRQGFDMRPSERLTQQTVAR